MQLPVPAMKKEKSGIDYALSEYGNLRRIEV